MAGGFGFVCRASVQIKTRPSARTSLPPTASAQMEPQRKASRAFFRVFARARPQRDERGRFGSCFVPRSALFFGRACDRDLRARVYAAAL